MEKSSDIYGVWNGEKISFTLRQLCNIIFDGSQYRLPEKLKKYEDSVLERVTADNTPIKDGLRVVFDLSWNVPPEESEKKIIDYLNQGVIVVSNRVFKDAKGRIYPVITVKDTWEAWIKLGQYVKAIFPMPTIAITGSAGKTTTTMFAECVFNQRYKTFVSGLDGRNFNTTLQIVNQWILRINPEYNFHVQECGAETPGLIEASARVINCDGFGITNIDTTQHIATYGTAEKLIADKTSFDRVRKESTFGIINLDDEILRNHEFVSDITTFAINDKSADYVGENIVQNGDLLEFDVLNEGNSVHIKIHIIGKHNVYNALLVFAFAKKFGFSDKEIQDGFLEYESVGIRQYLRCVSGRFIYMDAYNSSPESALLSVQALEDLHIPSYGKRIAIVGERKTSNDVTRDINFELGQNLARFEKIDELIIVGEDPSKITGKPDEITDKRYEHAVYDGARSVLGNNKKLSYYNNLEEIALRLRCTTKAGDAILFKGRYHLSLWSIADIAFGTDYTKSKAIIPLGIPCTALKSEQLSGDYYPHMQGVSLKSAVNGFDNTQLVLSRQLNGYSIVHINENAFENKTQLRMVVFGSRLRSIGDCAFRNTGLEQLELPKSCMYIGRNSFENCFNMVRANLIEVEHISKGAFRNCSKLKKVVLGYKCAVIEDNAFDGCENLTFFAPRESYAAKWAMSHNIAVSFCDFKTEKDRICKNGTRINPNIYALPKYENEDIKPLASNEDELSVVIAGDIMIHEHMLESAYDKVNGCYDFKYLFANTRKYLKGADLAIGNVETVMARGEFTGFPNFNSPDELADELADAGFDVAACANNHTFDMGRHGLIRTAKVLKRAGLAVCGIRDREDSKGYVVVEKKGIKIAVINRTYRTRNIGGDKSLNMHPMDAMSERLINTFSYETLDTDLRHVRTEIAEAKSDGADVILVYYHWGCEYERHSNTLQKYIAYKTAEMGADAIIGSHSHVIQEIDSVSVNINGEVRTVPVIYGMGNYCWGSRLPRTGRETVQNGMLAELRIHYDRNERKVKSVDCDYIPLYIKTDFILNKYNYSVLSLKDMDEYEVESFNEHSSKTVDEIYAEIDDTVKNRIHPLKSILKFDELINIKAGEKTNFSNYLDKSVLERVKAYRSENAPAAAVLQDGSIIAYSKGYVGMTVELDDGTELCYMVKISGKTDKVLPVVVDKYNNVPDIFRPDELVSGAEWKLPARVSLEKKTAEAWLKMKDASAKDKIYFYCSGGYRSNEGQLLNFVNRSAIYGEENAREYYAEIGHSEHHLGSFMNVTNIKSGNLTTDKKLAFDWLKDNAAKYGFLVNDFGGEYLHLRYIGNKNLAEILTAEGEYIDNYIKHMDEYEDILSAMEIRVEPHPAYDLHDNGDGEINFGRICSILNQSVPSRYESIKDISIPGIKMLRPDFEPGTAIMCSKNMPDYRKKCDAAINKGAGFFITDVVIRDKEGNPYPQIKVDNFVDAYKKICKYMRNRFEGQMICTVEGANVISKLIQNMLRGKVNLYAKTQADSRAGILNTLQNIDSDKSIVVQGIHPAYDGYMTTNTEILRPDILVLGNIPRIPEKYSSGPMYTKDFTESIKITLENGGMVFVNIDQKFASEFIGRKNVITYSIFNSKADYYVKNINVEENKIVMEIKCKADNRSIVYSYGAEGNKLNAIAAVAVCDRILH